MIRRPPRTTRSVTLFPYNTLIRSLICAKLVAIGGSRSRGSAAIVISIRRNRNDSLPGSRGSLMDIGYFLKLMTEKNASDMFLTTGAPVYIKVEGKLYPLGNTGLPQDRKSVVKGKSVAVRVDLGGRLINKK